MDRSDGFSFHLSNWLTNYLAGQGNLATGSICSYRDAFRLLLRYFDTQHGIAPGKVRLTDMTRDNIVGFLDWLEAERNVSASTRNQRLAAIRSFCRYVQQVSPEYIHGLNKVMDISDKKHRVPVRMFLRADEIALLLAQPDPSSFSGFRDQPLLSALYDTAARASELVAIRIRDVRLDAPPTITLHGKGNRLRTVPIMGKTAELLRSYLTRRSYNSGVAEGDHALFENQKHQPVTRWGVKYILDKYVQSARSASPSFCADAKITPHHIRHAKACHLLQAGVNLIYIRDLLGHADVSTTEIHARSDAEMKRKALEGAYESLTPDPYPRWEDDDGLMRWLDSLGR